MPSKQTDASERILNLAAEAGILKQVRRSGWWMIGIKNGESVAEHCFRTAVLGYLLAKLEKVDPYPVVMMSLFNDLHESRINDLHKVGHRYIDFRAAERKVAKEQRAGLPPEIRKDLAGWETAFVQQAGKAAVVARDADLLECMIQGKEYSEQGHPKAIDWVNGPKHLLKTKSAKKLAAKLQRWESAKWWEHLVKLER